MARTIELHGLDADNNPVSTTLTVSDDCTLFMNVDGGGDVEIENIGNLLEWTLTTTSQSGASETNPFLGERSMREEDR